MNAEVIVKETLETKIDTLTRYLQCLNEKQQILKNFKLWEKLEHKSNKIKNRLEYYSKIYQTLPNDVICFYKDLPLCFKRYCPQDITINSHDIFIIPQNISNFFEVKLWTNVENINIFRVIKY